MSITSLVCEACLEKSAVESVLCMLYVVSIRRAFSFDAFLMFGFELPNHECVCVYVFSGSAVQ